MKRLLFLVIAIFIFTNLFAQYPLAKGKIQLNTGIGIASSSIPLYVGFDYGFKSDITLGGEIMFYKNGSGIIANANYHFNELLSLDRKLNLYAGLNLGLLISKSTSNTSGNSTLNLGGQFGGRYKISSSIAINLEFGIGNTISDGKVGISARL